MDLKIKEDGEYTDVDNEINWKTYDFLTKLIYEKGKWLFELEFFEKNDP